MQLWHKHGTAPINAIYRRRSTAGWPTGSAIVGDARQGAAPRSRGQIAETGVELLVCRFAFGDMALTESLRSVDLFAREIRPALPKY